MNRILAIGSSALALAMLSGCHLDGRDNRASQEFHYSYDLRPGGHFDLTNTNGSVEVTGWDRNSIDVSGTKFATEQKDLDRVIVKVEAQGDTARISTQTPRNEGGGNGYGVDYRIHVPRQILLDRLETTNGRITAENLEGGGRIHSTNGKLSLTHLTGDYRIGTTNGQIELEECSGNEKVETTNGAIHGRQKSGSLEASSTNGSIDLLMEQPGNGKPIRATTTNGSITLALAQFRGNAIQAETTHGSVNLRLPEGTNARLRANTRMASISNDLKLTSTEEASKHELRGQLGSGGPEISASSSMGSIRIQRY